MLLEVMVVVDEGGGIFFTQTCHGYGVDVGGRVIFSTNLNLFVL